MRENEAFLSDEINDSEYYTEENCHILEIFNLPDYDDFSLARARVEVGQTTEWHWLEGIVESYYIVKGKGKVELGDDIIKEVGPSSFVKIPSGMNQRITNVGSEDLVFLCFCVPAFRQEKYHRVD